MAMIHPDSTYFKWLGRERDVLGMSGRDYYLENETYALSGVSPWLFRGDEMFKDQTCGLGMPYPYRPMVPCGAAWPSTYLSNLDKMLETYSS
ncbi:MAG: hypothetical protein QXH60_02970 [Candidatus Pacearchaeota archaeon]